MPTMQITAMRLVTLAAVLVLAGTAPAAAQTPADRAAGLTGGLEAAIDRPGLVVAPGALLARTVALRGRVDAADAGRTVRIERQVPGGAWQPVATVVAGPDGAFAGAWRTDQVGRVQLRAVIDRGAEVVAASTAPTARLTVFRAATASWYGPRFFGKRTACGIRLRRATVGVAHRTLPCGTPVGVYHRGRVLTVPVIDRGPFVDGRDWDLTQAAARKLGVTATTRIGVLPPADVPLKRRARG
jgi:rare lipoprotein A